MAEKFSQEVVILCRKLKIMLVKIFCDFFLPCLV